MAVPQMFNTISTRYDFINKVLSLGLDRYWRKAVIGHLPTKSRIKLLDCATGTGDQLVTLLNNCPAIYDAVGLDPAQQMLEFASKKLERNSHKCRLIQGRAEEIPFPDEMFDAITISFGIRNVADLSKSLREMYRTLVPKGRVILLEFSHPHNKWVRKLHSFYLNRIVPTVGSQLSNNKVAYRYLTNTIETFPQGEALCSILRQAGFTNVHVKPLTFGTVSIYIGEKR